MSLPVDLDALEDLIDTYRPNDLVDVAARRVKLVIAELRAARKVVEAAKEVNEGWAEQAYVEMPELARMRNALIEYEASA